MRRICAALFVLLCASSMPILARETLKAPKRAETILERIAPYWQELWCLVKNGSGIDPWGGK